MIVPSAVGFVVGLALLAAAQPAAAQAQGQGAGGPRRVQVLGLQLGANVSSADLADQPAFPGASALPNMNSRFHTDVQAAMRYQPVPGERVNYSVNIQSAVRRYQTSDEFMVLGHTAGGNAGLRVGRRMSLAGFGSASYLPSYGLNMNPTGDPFALATGAAASGQLSANAAAAGQLPASAVDYSLAERVSVHMGGGGSMQYNLARRLDFQASFQQSRQAFRKEEDPDLRSTSVAGRLTYRLSRYLGLKVGFQRRYADYATRDGVDTTVLDDIDAGLESGYGRQISLTRSTTLSFDTGSTLTHRNGRHGGQLTGRAYLAQRVGRRGEASLGVTRGTELREGFDEPVFSNNVTAEVRFTFLRDLTVSVSGAGAVGQALGEGDEVAADHVRSYQTSARVSKTFLSRGQAYAQYLVSGHDVGAAVGIVDGVPRRSASRSLRAGVMWSIALVTARPSNVPAPPQGGN